MAIGRDGQRQSRLAVCREASEIYLLTSTEADEIIAAVVTTINDEWDEAADAGRLTIQEAVPLETSDPQSLHRYLARQDLRLSTRDVAHHFLSGGRAMVGV